LYTRPQLQPWNARKRRDINYNHRARSIRLSPIISAVRTARPGMTISSLSFFLAEKSKRILYVLNADLRYKGAVVMPYQLSRSYVHCVDHSRPWRRRTKCEPGPIGSTMLLFHFFRTPKRPTPSIVKYDWVFSRPQKDHAV
jgi:hypothetical protein